MSKSIKKKLNPEEMAEISYRISQEYLKDIADFIYLSIEDVAEEGAVLTDKAREALVHRMSMIVALGYKIREIEEGEDRQS